MYSTVAGGVGNAALGLSSTVNGGASDSALGNFSSVPGGQYNVARGGYSFAGGRRADAYYDGCFVWADATDDDLRAVSNNQFLIRASGGVGINSAYTDINDLFVAGNVYIDGDSLGNSQDALKVRSSLFDGPNSATHFAGIETSADIVGSGADMLRVSVGGESIDDFQFIECKRTHLFTYDTEFRVWGNGDVTADGTISGGGADFAEMLPVSGGVQSVEPGDVMVIDPNNPRALVRSSAARSTLVCGIYSTRPGFVASERDWDQVAIERGFVKTDAPESSRDLPVVELAREIGEVSLAVVGIVPCKVTAENGPIRPGDLLVTSSTPGHAMRDDDPKTGTVLGKALGSLNSSTGIIDVLVTLQ